MKRTKDPQAARLFIDAVAHYRGWTVNGDRGFVDRLAVGLAENYNRYGFYQCPCRDSWGDPTKDGDIACPCAYSEADLAEFGQCYCGLFVTKAFAERSAPVRPIPERRSEDRFP